MRPPKDTPISWELLARLALVAHHPAIAAGLAGGRAWHRIKHRLSASVADIVAGMALHRPLSRAQGHRSCIATSCGQPRLIGRAESATRAIYVIACRSFAVLRRLLYEFPVRNQSVVPSACRGSPGAGASPAGISRHTERPAAAAGSSCCRAGKFHGRCCRASPQLHYGAAGAITRLHRAQCGVRLPSQRSMYHCCDVYFQIVST